jgi:MFS superfamily sulfate permease-like transporter
VNSCCFQLQGAGSTEPVAAWGIACGKTTTVLLPPYPESRACRRFRAYTRWRIGWPCRFARGRPWSARANRFSALTDGFNLPTVAISAAVLAVIIGVGQLAPRLPGALIAVIGAIAASVTFNFAAKGIATIGIVPGGLPSLALPPVSANELHLVLTCAASCHGLVLDLTGIDDVDYTAAKMLLQVRGELNKRGVTVVSAAVSADAIDNLRRYGLAGDDFDRRVYPTIDAAITALGARSNPATAAQ